MMSKRSFFILPLIAVASAFFSSCEYWHEPVREYLENWTEKVYIERFELDGIESYYDKNGNLCIASDRDAPVNLILLNPHHYKLTNLPNTVALGSPKLTQDPNDSTMLHFTYDRVFLGEKEGGGEIGTTLTLKHPYNPTEKDFTFSLKCNSKPPMVKGSSLQVGGDGKYVVCFYLPVSELTGNTHSMDTHTLYINGNAVATGTAYDIESASAERPDGLAPLHPEESEVVFSNDGPVGYPAFYYITTERSPNPAEYRIWLSDDDGLDSKVALASTESKRVNLSVSGGNTLEMGQELVLTCSLDQGAVAESYEAESSDDDVVTAEVENNKVILEPKAGGTATITVRANLPSGQISQTTHSVRVLQVNINASNNPEMMLVGGVDSTFTATALGFPSTPAFTWTTSDPNVATVSGGVVTAIGKGSATIKVSATYDEKTVTATRSVNVCAVNEIEGESIGFCGSDMTFSIGVDAPNGETPTLEYSWSSTNLTILGERTNDSCTGSATNSGSATVKVQVTCGTKTLTKTKSLTIYGIDVGTANGITLMTKTGGGSSLTLTPSLKSGNTTYSGGETVAYTYSYSGSTVTVNPDGVVTAQNTGDAEITVTATIGSGANAKTTTTTKTVSVIDLGGPSKFYTGQSSSLTPSPQDAPSGVSYSWESSDSTVASVSVAGVVTGRGKGPATITLTAKRSEQDKIEITKTINVTKVIYDSNIYPIADGKVELPFLGLAAYKVSLDPAEDFSLVSATTSDTSKVTARLPSTQTTAPKFYVEPQSAGASADVKVKLKVGEVEYEVTAFNVKGTNCLSTNSDAVTKYLATLEGTGVGTKENPVKLPLASDQVYGYSFAQQLQGDTGVYVDLSNITITPDNLGNTFNPSFKGLFEDCVKIVNPPKLEGFTGESLERCFKGCSNLEEAPVLPSGITSLSRTFEGTAIKTPPTIPSSVTNMANTFNGCEELTTPPTIPNGVTDMAATFSGCKKLTSVPSIPSSVTEMGACFENCEKIVTGPTISANVKSMFYCFSGCTSLETVTIQYDHNNTNSSSRTAVSYDNTFKNCTAITGVTFQVKNTTSEQATAAKNTLINANGNGTISAKVTLGSY